MESSSSLLYGSAPRARTDSGEDAWGQTLPRFERCGCSGGYAGCIGLGSPECCGACDEPCESCKGYASHLAVKLTRGRPGDEDDQEAGYTLITLDEATEHELELAQRHEDERWKLTYGEAGIGSTFAPLQVLGDDDAVVVSSDMIPF